MNKDTSQIGQLQVIVDDAADRRLADRLVRAGLPVASTPLVSLKEPVCGILYVLTGVRAATVDARRITRVGAHLCLLPPFPEQPLTFAAGRVTFASAERRGRAYLSRSVFEADGSSAIPARPLHILYRDRIAAGASISLVESTEGEVLAGVLPRASNLDGQLIVSTLMLGTASAQTSLDDIAVLIRSLVAWCNATETVPVGEPAIAQSQVSAAVSGEHDARLVLLALAMTDTQPDTTGATTVTLAEIQPVFERVTALLGETPGEQSLIAGWNWLRAHGVLIDDPASAADVAYVVPAVMREFIQMWQLQPRLRRLASRVSPR